MREENRAEIIHEALNLLEDELLLETDELREKSANILVERGSISVNNTDNNEESTKSRKREVFHKKSWRRLTTIAASLAVFFIAGAVWNEVIVQNQADEGIVEESAVEDTSKTDIVTDVIYEEADELNPDPEADEVAKAESQMLQESQVQIHLPNQSVESLKEELQIDVVTKIKEVDGMDSFIEACAQMILLLYEEVKGGLFAE